MPPSKTGPTSPCIVDHLLSSRSTRFPIREGKPYGFQVAFRDEKGQVVKDVEAKAQIRTGPTQLTSEGS